MVLERRWPLKRIGVAVLYHNFGLSDCMMIKTGCKIFRGGRGAREVYNLSFLPPSLPLSHFLGVYLIMGHGTFT
jgi:hypothetical protein